MQPGDCAEATCHGAAHECPGVCTVPTDAKIGGVCHFAATCPEGSYCDVTSILPYRGICTKEKQGGVGASCGDAIASGLSDDCADGLTCVANKGEYFKGTCQVPLEPGASCETGKCKSGTHCQLQHLKGGVGDPICVKPSAEGGVCNFEIGSCQWRLLCVRAHGADVLGTCREPARLGEPCLGRGHCAEYDAWCKPAQGSGTRKCAPLPGVGETCVPYSWKDVPVGAGYSTGFFLLTGCASGLDCDGYNDDICTPALKPGDECWKTDLKCPAGTICHLGQCHGQIIEGASCGVSHNIVHSWDDPCTYGTRCKKGTCTASCGD